MTENEHPQSPPTYFANWVTLTVNTDELAIEFRRVDRPHRETADQTLIPGPSPQDALNREPLARVVVTYTAAKALWEYLNNTMPRVAEARRTGEPLR